MALRRERVLALPAPAGAGQDGATGGPSRDRRTGGSWSGLQRVKNDAIWWMAIALLAVATRTPLSVLRLLGRALGSAAHRLARGPRRTAIANVARVFPQLTEEARARLVRRSFVSLGEWLGETAALLRTRDRPPLLAVDPDVRPLIDRALSEGRGVVLPSAHLGPWEQVAASLVAAGVPLVTMARESYDPRFSELYTRVRASAGVRVVWRASAGAAARIVRALRAGDVLGVPMDLASRVPSCDAPFLGHLAPTPIGPAKIALRARAPVVVGTAAPGPGSSLIVTATRIPTHDLAADDDGAIALTARINAELSRRIADLAHGWVWMHERWPAKESVE